MRPSPPALARGITTLVVVLVAAACGGNQGTNEGSSPSSSPRSPSSSPSPSFRPTALEAPASRCGFPHAPARTLWFTASDGTHLDGAVVGAGPTGIVLMHQYPAELCGWWPYAVTLGRLGFRVLLFDFRCDGLSECPDDGRAGVRQDADAAVATLRSTGTDRVILMGASYGAVVSLVAGGAIRPPLDGVVSLSGETDLTNLIGAPLDAHASVRRLDVPTLFVVARDDPAVSVGETRAMYERTATSDKQLVVLPAFFGHGWLMMTDALGTPTRVSSTVVDWIRAHT